jgi:hypothetical protein
MCDACAFITGIRRAFLSRGCALGFITLTLTCFSVSQLHAQVLYGSLTGNVSDVSNAPIPGAKIEAANVGTGIATEGVTDTRGVYLINNLQPGVYRVTIAAQGFATVVQENVRVDANTTRRADVQMEVARVNQTITVKARAETLQTDRTDVKSELASSQITNLPLGTDRNFQSLYILVPGAAPPISSHSYAGNPTQSLAMYINGGAETANMTLIDGTIDTNFWEQDIIAFVPPAEAIESVNIVTGGFDAEQGQAAGSVTNVAIKSGTNVLHGSAWEYNTNNALQSRNYFYYGPSMPKYIINQFGISLGGPIKKNKLFFFADWERYRESWYQTVVTSVPTQAIRQGNFSSVSTTIYNSTTGNPDGSGRSQMGAATGALNVIPPTMISSAAAKMADLIPLPNYGTGGIANNYQAMGDLLFHRDSVDLKINYIPSNKSTFFARYSAEPTWIFDPNRLGAAGGAAVSGNSQPGTAPGLIQCAALGGTYTFTPRLLLDANVGYTRPRIAAENTDIGTNFGLTTLGIPGTNGPNRMQGGIPYFAISNLAPLGNSNIANPFVFFDNQYTVAANLSWIKGSHSFRFGGTLGRYDLNQFQGDIAFGVRGGFSFTGGLTALKGGPAPNAYNSWADFLLGLPQSMGKDYVYTNPLTMRENEWAFYARDNWQVTKNLSVNYGVRYEAYPVPSRDHYGASNYDPTTNTAYLGEKAVCLTMLILTRAMDNFSRVWALPTASTIRLWFGRALA